MYPSWTAIWTPEQAESSLENFKFKGDGWYYTKTDSLLVQKVDSERYRFQIFCIPSNEIQAELEWMINAPVREDKQ